MLVSAIHTTERGILQFGNKLEFLISNSVVIVGSPVG